MSDIAKAVAVGLADHIQAKLEKCYTCHIENTKCHTIYVYPNRAYGPFLTVYVNDSCVVFSNMEESFITDNQSVSLADPTMMDVVVAKAESQFKLRGIEVPDVAEYRRRQYVQRHGSARCEIADANAGCLVCVAMSASMAVTAIVTAAWPWL